MHREQLLRILECRVRCHPEDAAVAARIAALARSHERCFFRDCMPGHITGSAFIVDHAGERFLLHHHKKLDRWLQFGGHADGASDPLAVARREALEESGIEGLVLLAETVAPDSAPLPTDITAAQEGVPCAASGVPLPLPADLDVHVIPARGTEPEHEHHDLRYVFRAPAHSEAMKSDESLALRWFPVADLEQVIREEGLLRLARKALALARQS